MRHNMKNSWGASDLMKSIIWMSDDEIDINDIHKTAPCFYTWKRRGSVYYHADDESNWHTWYTVKTLYLTSEYTCRQKTHRAVRYVTNYNSLWGRHRYTMIWLHTRQITQWMNKSCKWTSQASSELRKQRCRPTNNATVSRGIFQ